MSSERKYIYGIILAPEPVRLSLRGVDDAEVYAVQHREVAALVSDIGVDQIDPTRKNVRAHTLAQDELLKVYTLLPMGFGMIAGNESQVSTLLERNYQGLRSELSRLDGKVEVELKVYWDQGAMIEELQRGNGDLTRMRARIRNAPSAIEAQRLLVEAGGMVEHVALEWKAKYADRVYGILKAASVDARLGDPLAVKNILNASFLIEKASEKHFRDEIEELDRQYRGKVNFKYVGPLAPYSFVKLKLEPASW